MIRKIMWLYAASMLLFVLAIPVGKVAGGVAANRATSTAAYQVSLPLMFEKIPPPTSAPS